MANKLNEAEARSLLVQAQAIANRGTTMFPGLSYEQGVADAMKYLLEGGEHPFTRPELPEDN